MEGVAIGDPPVATLYQASVKPVLGVTCWVKLRAVPWQMFALVVAGALGRATTVTTICARGPSHPVVVFIWLTQYEVVPAAAVEGVGAVVLAVPPVELVYHLRVFPEVAVAESGLAVWPMQ